MSDDNTKLGPQERRPIWSAGGRHLTLVGGQDGAISLMATTDFDAGPARSISIPAEALGPLREALNAPPAGECDLCVGRCRGHSLGHPEQWEPEPGSRAALTCAPEVPAGAPEAHAREIAPAVDYGSSCDEFPGLGVVPARLPR